jgi:hypothetical protein
MEELRVQLIGNAPLLIHNNRAANPLSDYAKAMKSLTSKRKKTDKDYEYIARLEWEAGLYLHDGIISIPARCLERCFLQGAMKMKNGPKYKAGAMVKDDFLPLSYKGSKIRISTGNGKEIPNPELDAYFDIHKHQDMVKVGNNQVLRTRPIFHEWRLDVTIMYDENIIDRRTLLESVQTAGNIVGLCEQRPRLGRFAVEEV